MDNKTYSPSSETMNVNTSEDNIYPQAMEPLPNVNEMYDESDSLLGHLGLSPETLTNEWDDDLSSAFPDLDDKSVAMSESYSVEDSERTNSSVSSEESIQDAPRSDSLDGGGAKEAKPAKYESPIQKKRRRIRKVHDPPVGQRVYVLLSDLDVGSARGAATNKHPGNIRYLKAKDRLQPEYLSESLPHRTDIAQKLVDEVHAWGGRFLKKDNIGGWYEIHNSTARTKAAQALRETYTQEERAKKRAMFRQRRRERKNHRA